MRAKSFELGDAKGEAEFLDGDAYVPTAWLDIVKGLAIALKLFCKAVSGTYTSLIKRPQTRMC